MANRTSGVSEEVSAVDPDMSSDVAVEEEVTASNSSDIQSQERKQLSWLRRYDSLDLESRKLHGHRSHHSDAENQKWSVVLQLAFQSIGIVYGDIGTSPLYVYSSTFPDGIKHNDDVLAALSLIFYTITLIPVIKYVFIVLRANDNGEGGTFALYSLICRYAKVGLIPNEQIEDREVSNYQLNLPNEREKRASKIQTRLEKSYSAKAFLLFATMLGTSMVIGDGVLTPCISGTEALFADVGHFSVRSIQLSMSAVTYPALICAYLGQASFLRKHNDLVSDTFYKSIPGGMYWPMFVVAVSASIIASQAMISGTFSIIQQSLSLGCFPRVKVVHTSAKYEGQVYVPEINYLLMLACVGVTLGFKNTTKIGNAYGIAVVFVMTLTSSFLVLIMVIVWKTHILFIITYILIIGSVEFLYLSSVLYKFDQGGYLPLAFAAVLMTIMYVWNSVFRKKYFYELNHKISSEKLNEMVNTTSFRRIPGMALFYSELVQGIPPIFKHYVEHVPALHSVLVFVTIKSLPVSKVPADERFLFRQVEAKEIDVFRCVVRYGYTDVHTEQESFEKILLKRLEEFEKEQRVLSNGENGADGGVVEAWKDGVVHLVGETEVVAQKEAGFGKRIMINYAYSFLKRNLRQTDQMFDIPHKHMLKVGMTYEL